MSSSRIVNKTENIIKSENDDRQYRGFVLSNKLKAIVISDPKADKASASLDLNIGHMCDPDEIPGLAHFCEHMLFMGTKKYPDENEYSKFLNEHNGYSNAFTGSENTNYQFQVSPNYLEGALDRFSQFFIEPLFNESSTSREMNAVNSENDKNLAHDGWRIQQLKHSLCDLNHSYSKFGTGNLQTLKEIPEEKGIDTRNELIKFHKKYYSANLMSVAVLSNHSLDELEKFVVDMFSDIPNSDIKLPFWDKHPFTEKNKGSMLKVVSIKNIRNLIITFPFPNMHPYYKFSPASYLAHLIGHEGEGSILSELKSLGWANSLCAGLSSSHNGFSFFSIDASLTPDGLVNIDEVIKIIFQYTKMLKKTGPLEWVFEECKKLHSMQFRFKERERPLPYVVNLSSALHRFPMEEVLSAGYIFNDWNPDIVEMLTDKLLPEEAQIIVQTKGFEDITQSTEKWYGTKYHEEKIENSLIKKWNNSEDNPKLFIHCPNDFIPTNFDQVDRDKDTKEHPLIVKETPLSTLWFKQDNEFQRPKSILHFEIRSPLAYIDPNNANLLVMYVNLLNDSLNEYTYAATLAGLNYSISSTRHGLILQVMGYNEKQHVFLEKIVSRMVELKIDENRFAVIKENVERSKENFSKEQPHQLASYNKSMLLVEKFWHNDHTLEELKYLQKQDLERFIPMLFSRIHINCFMYGNITEDHSTHILNSFENTFKTVLNSRSLFKSEFLRDRVLDLPHNSDFAYVLENNVHKSSCIDVYFQFGKQGIRDNVLIDLICQIINEPFFNILRTQEQLGYIVTCQNVHARGSLGIRFLIQSDRHPNYLNSRIESFLIQMEESIQNMTDEEFEHHKNSLKEHKLEKPKKLLTQFNKFWSEIYNVRYNFQSDILEAEEIDKISKKDILDVYNEKLMKDQGKRKKISCHIVSMVEEGAGKNNEIPTLEDSVSLITNVEAFKNNLALSPLLKPYENICSFKKY